MYFSEGKFPQETHSSKAHKGTLCSFSFSQFPGWPQMMEVHVRLCRGSRGKHGPDSSYAQLRRLSFLSVAVRRQDASARQWSVWTFLSLRRSLHSHFLCGACDFVVPRVPAEVEQGGPQPVKQIRQHTQPVSPGLHLSSGPCERGETVSVLCGWCPL